MSHRINKNKSEKTIENQKKQTWRINTSLINAIKQMKWYFQMGTVWIWLVLLMTKFDLQKSRHEDIFFHCTHTSTDQFNLLRILLHCGQWSVKIKQRSTLLVNLIKNK